MILVLPFTACDKGSATSSELSGKVMYKGAPLKMGAVMVKGDSGSEEGGSINSDGTYTIKNVPRGNLKVRITSIDEEGLAEYNRAVVGRGKGEPTGPDGKVRPKGSPILDPSEWSKIPKKYGEYETSGLTVEVNDSKVKKDFAID
jgi:hypothetical protein